MTRFSLFASLLALLFSGASARASDLPSAFNGNNFQGWILPENNIWYTAKDGVLRLQSGPEQKGSNLWTKKSYGNFIMEFEFKIDPGRIDTGVMVRNEKVQIQIGESGSLKRDMTGSPYVAGKGYPVEAKGIKELLKYKEWNAMTIVAIGKNLSVWLNGQHVMSYDLESEDERGPLGIQLHSKRDMSAEYRNISIAELD